MEDLRIDDTSLNLNQYSKDFVIPYLLTGSHTVWATDAAGNPTSKSLYVQNSPFLQIPLTHINPQLGIINGQTNPGNTVVVGSLPVTVEHNGSFIIPSSLTTGSYSVVAMSPDGDTTTTMLNVLTSQPLLTIPSTPVNPSLSQLIGTTIPGATVAIDKMSINVDSFGNFAIPSTLQNGCFNVTSTDQAGNQTTSTLHVKTIPPTLNVVFNASSCAIQDSTDIGSLVTVGGQSASVDGSGNFTFSSNLAPGIYPVVAQDQAGNISTRSVRVTPVL